MGEFQKPLHNNIFVSSFSFKKDDLNQWRGYCPKGNGFCVGFDTKKLLRLLEGKSVFDLIPCFYEKKDQIELFNLVFKPLVEEFNLELKKFLAGKNPDDANYSEEVTQYAKTALNSKILSTMSKVLDLAPRFKHPSFLDEKEWRIVTKPNVKDDSLIHYRPGKSMVVPYTIINFDDVNPIIEIIIGPTPHEFLSKKSIKGFLKKHEMTSINVTNSIVPYRDW